MIRPGLTYIERGATWMVVAVGADGLCTVMADDPLRAGTFDEEVAFARVPLADLTARLADLVA